MISPALVGVITNKGGATKSMQLEEQKVRFYVNPAFFQQIDYQLFIKIIFELC